METTDERLLERHSHPPVVAKDGPLWSLPQLPLVQAMVPTLWQRKGVLMMTNEPTEAAIEAGLEVFNIGPTGWPATDIESISTIYRAMAGPCTKADAWMGDRNELRVRLQRCLLAELGDTYDCTRVWSAWSYGTMGEDDFVPVLDRMDALIDALAATLDPTGEKA